MRDRHGAVLHPGQVPVGMVPVMMRIEHEPDRFVGDGLDLGEDLLGAGGEVPVDDEHVVGEHDPAVVAMAVAFEVAFVEVDVGGEFSDLVYLGRSGTGEPG